MTEDEALRLAEALVFASAAPVSARALPQLLPDGVDAEAVLAALRERYAGRGVELVEVAGGVQFRTAPGPRAAAAQGGAGAAPAAARGDGDAGDHRLPPAGDARRDRGDPRHQPVAATLDALLEADLIAPHGRRESPAGRRCGAPRRGFLAQFGLKDLRELPRREDLLVEPPGPGPVRSNAGPGDPRPAHRSAGGASRPADGRFPIPLVSC